MGRKKDIFEDITLARVPYFYSHYRPSFFLILFILVAVACLVLHFLEGWDLIKRPDWL